MNQELNKLTKNELLEILSNFKKKELIEIIDNKIGGNINNAERIPIKFNKNKLNKKINNAMANDPIYNTNNN